MSTSFPHLGPLTDPLRDAEELRDASERRRPGTYTRVGSARPSTMMYTYGPGAVMDLPNFTVMPHGLDAWDLVGSRMHDTPLGSWPRRTHVESTRLLGLMRKALGSQVSALVLHPWRPAGELLASGLDAWHGVPARVFPQWLKCTHCSYLGPLGNFHYENKAAFRPDEAQFWHQNCADTRPGTSRKKSVAVPSRHLLACPDGHLDEFPYDWWVHHGKPCPEGAQDPHLLMKDRVGGHGANSTIECQACRSKRSMSEAKGLKGEQNLPQCRGRHPHLDAFAEWCPHQAQMLLVGASNLWFPAVQSVIVMPEDRMDPVEKLALDLLECMNEDFLRKYQDNLEVIRDMAHGKTTMDLQNRSDEDILAAINSLDIESESDETLHEQRNAWDPLTVYEPEWRYLDKEFHGRETHEETGLTVESRNLHPDLHEHIKRVVAVVSLRKANALMGFTRIDEMDRVNDLGSRLVPLCRSQRPTWVPATEDHGEGILVTLPEGKVRTWEQDIERSELWESHKRAFKDFREVHHSDTAALEESDTLLPKPRYWLLHTLAHILLREMASSSGYGAASISERIYAWPEADKTPDSPARRSAAGLLLYTTASDSDGTLGGLVRLSDPQEFRRTVRSALRKAWACSSDPVCAVRKPKSPETFLHGAACHCCCMASETSCERGNTFLDRRFLITLPGSDVEGFFGIAEMPGTW